MADWSRLKTLEDGAKIYLVPLSPFYGVAGGFALGGSGVKFLNFRCIIRGKAGRIFDQIIAAHEIDSLLAQLPSALCKRTGQLLDQCSKPRPAYDLGTAGLMGFGKSLIMGVLNVTPDSFSDGGDFIDPEKAIAHARSMRAAGADIIDIGGESTRPGAKPVWEGDEADRVRPVIEALASEGVPLSIDTRHSFVMKEALKAGAHIINDVSALTYDGDSMAAAAASDAPVILMHAQGKPETMQENPAYSDVVLDVFDYLEDRIAACQAAGIASERIVVDPGIGFGKAVVQDNITLINNMAIFHMLGCPVLLGASRKRFIGAIAGVEEAKDRMAGSLMALASAVMNGIQIIRVHDVAESRQAVALLQAMKDVSFLMPSD